uniref:Uncharacterized protein n=1 Tax=Oryza meridionalis TaxID=40149 RepID=A0A0E0DV87_9ORYZ
MGPTYQGVHISTFPFSSNSLPSTFPLLSWCAMKSVLLTHAARYQGACATRCATASLTGSSAPPPSTSTPPTGPTPTSPRLQLLVLPLVAATRHENKSCGGRLTIRRRTHLRSDEWEDGGGNHKCYGERDGGPHLAKRRPATISSKPQATGTPLSLSSVNSIDLLRLPPSLTGIPVDAKIRCRLRWIRKSKVKTVHPFVAAKERRTPPSPWTRPRRCLELPLPSVVVELPLGSLLPRLAGCDSGVGTGPNGELRYPSGATGGGRVPLLRHKYMLQQLRRHAAEAGEPLLGLSGPRDSPDACGFFKDDGILPARRPCAKKREKLEEGKEMTWHPNMWGYSTVTSDQNHPRT